MEITNLKQRFSANRAVLSLIAAIALTGVGLVLTPIAFAHASPAVKQGTPHTYTIYYYSASGHLQQVWKGSRTQQLARLQQERNKHVSSRHSQAVNPLINRVNGCSDPNDFWDVRNYPPLVCFANRGSISVNIYQVYEVDSGNNTEYFTIRENDGTTFNISIPTKFSSAVCGGCTWDDNTFIHIN